VRDNKKAKRESPYVFISERKGPMTDSAFRKIVARAGDVAELGMPVHPHMLRHATGFKLANDGQDKGSAQIGVKLCNSASSCGSGSAERCYG